MDLCHSPSLKQITQLNTTADYNQDGYQRHARAYFLFSPTPTVKQKVGDLHLLYLLCRGGDDVPIPDSGSSFIGVESLELSPNLRESSVDEAVDE
jgi:hypothetical protein